jgi:hypothetical protein
MRIVSFLAYTLLRRSLLILFVLGGIAVAIMRWKRHPRVSLMTVIALGFYLIESFAASIFFYSLPNSFGTTAISSSTIYTAIYFIEDFAFAAVLILLVAAAFTGRRPATAMNS